MPRSSHGGRHELGQNFLVHQPTLDLLITLTAHTRGSLLEIGCGDGVLTRRLIALGRPLTAIDIDEHRVARLRRSISGARIEHADVLRHPLQADVIIGNIPFHLTTPILRRLLRLDSWHSALLLTQWEVARKRAGVGGGTPLTAQTAPWFTFDLHGRVPAQGFSPRPSVDGGVLGISRRGSPLVALSEKRAYEDFVRRVFTGRGGSFSRIAQHATGISAAQARRICVHAGIGERALPRDLSARQWAALWHEVRQ